MIGIELTHPVYRTPNADVVLGIGLDKRKSESFLLGQPFPFSLGTEDGLSRVTALRLTQRFSKRELNEALSFRSVFSFGIDAFNATIHDAASAALNCGATIPASECPDSDFMAWLGQLQYARRFSIDDRAMSFIFRADVQLADGPLLGLEQFSIGGAKTVRGFRENQLVRDNGFVSSVELRIPVFIKEDGTTSTQLVPFIDYGRSWNEGRSTPHPRTLSSFGLGLLWNPDRHFSLEMHAAKALRKIECESFEHDLQDSGLHFQMSYKF
jgi:hemolysin activation/secretion protein